jgi:hypothetical protein
MPPWPRFQPPPRQTQRADVPHDAFLLAACQALWDLSGWERFQPWAVHPGGVAQAEALLPPRPPPPLPPEAPPLPCTPQMPSDLLCHPIFDVTTAPTGVPHRTGTAPAPPERGEQRAHPIAGWRRVPPAYRLPRPPPGRALLQPGRIPRPPDAASTAHPPAVTAQEAAMLPLGQGNDPALRLMAGALAGRQCLPEAGRHGLAEPILLRRGLHHDPAILRTPGRCEGGGGTTTGDRFGPLQPLLHRGAIPMTASRCEHPAWRNALRARDQQPQRAPMEPFRGVAPWRHLGSHEVRSALVAVRLQLHVTDASLVLHHRLCHPQDRVLGRALWALAVRTRLAVRCNEGLQEKLEPTFKGVWYAALNFGPLPLRDTRLDQCPQPHRRSDDEPGRHGPGGVSYSPRPIAPASPRQRGRRPRLR